EEMSSVWGRGNATQFDPRGPSDDDDQTKPPCPPDGGMLTHRIHLMMASVHLQDMPLRYAPPVGPGGDLTIAYNQRESQQPQTFAYTNLGAKWTLKWLSYVIDDPTNANAPVGVFRRGGGQDPFSGFNGGTGLFAQDTRSHAILKRVSSAPIHYERLLPDGSVE